MFAPYRVALLALGLSLAACDQTPRFTQSEPGEALSAGSATVFKHDHNAFRVLCKQQKPK